MTEAAARDHVKYEPLGFARFLLFLVTVVVSAWYLWWRLSTINHGAPVFSYLLYAGECFGVVTLLLHFYMVRRLTVREAPLPAPGHTVDIFIPTINEPVDIVRRTAVKAISMEYPHTTYILDDGNRPEMRALAEELGCEYLARGTNEHAKAGNLNDAYEHSKGEFIAIFDADHAPKSNFLMRTLGYFTDPKVAFVQTPQDFYNLDSYQHRVSRKTGRVWTEQSLYFRVIQRGKDYTNSAFFCGSCAIIRRSALDAIGGFATGTVTEDIHTSIRIHKYGFKSVYHAEPLAFGIAPAQIEPFLKQRIRWGQGAMQVWRKEGVIFNRHLTLAQKLNYVASMITYFDGWQKAVYYVTPVIVLVTGYMPLITTLPEFLMHFVPYFLVSLWCFEELGRGYGETLLVEQYNMARFAALCYSTLGLFMGNLKFRVTNKKLTASNSTFWYLFPQCTVLLLNLLAIPVGFFFYNEYAHITYYSLLANTVWATVNLSLSALVLIFSLRRSKFRRNNYRFSIPLVARIKAANGNDILASVDDLSCAGLYLLAPGDLALKPGDKFTGILFLPDGQLTFESVVRVIHRANQESGNTLEGLGCEFLWNDNVARERMERFLYGSDLEWHLHNFSEMNWTPFGAISGDEHKSEMLQGWDKNKTSKLSSLVLDTGDATPNDVSTGIVSMDPRTQRGTLLMFRPLPENSAVNALTLTQEGWKSMHTKVANQNVSSNLSNMYLYELEGVPA